MQVVIDRGFARIPSGRVHYRFTAAPPDDAALPLYMAHAGPGSSLGLTPLIDALAGSRRVIAPDLLGQGDSEPHRLPSPRIEDYADDVVALLDVLGIERVDFYGQHSGAHIGCELALRHPSRVRRLILDGIALYEPELRADLLARYAPPMEPDENGEHLLWAWRLVRDLTLHFPYYRRDAAHLLPDGVVRLPQVRHAQTVDLLKALSTYHLLYRAAFAHPAAERLCGLRLPTLLLSIAGDPLSRYAKAAAALLPTATSASATRATCAARIAEFLEAENPC